MPVPHPRTSEQLDNHPASAAHVPSNSLNDYHQAAIVLSEVNGSSFAAILNVRPCDADATPVAPPASAHFAPGRGNRPAAAGRTELLAQLPTGACAVDTNGRIIDANTACGTIAGLAVNDLLVDVVHPDDRGALSDELAAVLAGNQELLDQTIRLIDPADRHIRLFGSRLDNAQSPAIACSIIDVTDWVKLGTDLAHRANRDVLTGLLNRSAIERELSRRLEGAGTTHLAALFLDLDGFKDINDAYGHQLGDEFLRTIASRLAENVRPGDALGRLGGDEFLILMSTDRRGESAGQLAARLICEVGRPIAIGTSELLPRVSIGVALGTASTSSERLLADADLAMYDAKVGRTSIAFANERTRDEVNLRVGIERDLLAAMGAGEVQFHFQPIRLLHNLEPLGAEALVRWTHPTLGAIPPPKLIERAEAVGRIADFTVWGTDVVSAHLADLRSRVPLFRDKGFGVNATIRQLALPNYVDTHLETIARHGLRPADIIVELTEYEAVGRGGAAEATLVELAAQGVPLAIDDFGVGYAALDYLTRLPVAVIKVDRSLISGIGNRPAQQVVLKGLVAMASELGFETLAEGIETRDELQVCTDLGLRAAQGYLLGRPKPIDQFEATDALWTPDFRLFND